SSDNATTNATAASNSGCAAHTMKTANASGCTAHGAAMKTASSECGAHGASMKSAGYQCGEHGTSAAGSTACKLHGTTATAEQCFGHGMLTVSDASIHSDCDACADMATCAQALEQNGAHTQVLPLKNGVMFVYTTDTPG